VRHRWKDRDDDRLPQTRTSKVKFHIRMVWDKSTQSPMREVLTCVQPNDAWNGTTVEYESVEVEMVVVVVAVGRVGIVVVIVVEQRVAAAVVAVAARE
jgi:hypothetical protein